MLVDHHPSIRSFRLSNEDGSMRPAEICGQKLLAVFPNFSPAHLLLNGQKTQVSNSPWGTYLYVHLLVLG